MDKENVIKNDKSPPRMRGGDRTSRRSTPFERFAVPVRVNRLEPNEVDLPAGDLHHAGTGEDRSARPAERATPRGVDAALRCGPLEEDPVAALTDENLAGCLRETDVQHPFPVGVEHRGVLAGEVGARDALMTHGPEGQPPPDANLIAHREGELLRRGLEDRLVLCRHERSTCCPHREDEEQQNSGEKKTALHLALLSFSVVFCCYAATA